MEAHIINIMRFGICILTLAVSVRAMIRTASPKIRRLTAVLAAVLIFFNEKAGEAAYLVFGSLLEMTAAVVALGFVLRFTARDDSCCCCPRICPGRRNHDHAASGGGIDPMADTLRSRN